MRLWIKTGAAILAFVPMALYFLSGMLVTDGILSEKVGRYIAIGSGLFNLPAFTTTAVVKSFQFSKSTQFLVLVCSMLLWSSFLAWVFWQIAKEFLGEDEPEFETNPERAKFDWIGFQVRFCIGFVVGFLFGWRFVRYSTSKATLLTAMIITGLFCGLAYGLYRPSFWSR